MTLGCRHLASRQGGDENRRDKLLHEDIKPRPRALHDRGSGPGCRMAGETLTRGIQSQCRVSSARPSRGLGRLLRTQLRGWRHHSTRRARMPAVLIPGHPPSTLGRVGRLVRLFPALPGRRKAHRQIALKSLILLVEATPGIEPG